VTLTPAPGVGNGVAACSIGPTFCWPPDPPFVVTLVSAASNRRFVDFMIMVLNTMVGFLEAKRIVTPPDVQRRNAAGRWEGAIIGE
jgi:hypothetical protein